MIRPGGPGDVEPLRGLRERYRAELEAVGRSAGRATRRAGRAGFRRRLSAGDVRVGLANARPVAYIAWEVRTLRPGARLLDVEELYVAPEVRGQRMGSGRWRARSTAPARSGCSRWTMDRGVGDEAVTALLGQFGFEERGEQLARPLRAGPLG